MFELTPFEHSARNLTNFFDAFGKNFFGDMSTAFSALQTDILDEGDHFLLKANLPGFDKDDIHIDISEGRLTIGAEHEEAHEEKRDSFVRRERSSGSFRRCFDLADIQTDAIRASYRNGVLELTLPKANAVGEEPRRIDIEYVRYYANGEACQISPAGRTMQSL